MGPGAFPPPFGFGGMYQYLGLRGGGWVGVIFVCCGFRDIPPPRNWNISLSYEFLIIVNYIR